MLSVALRWNDKHASAPIHSVSCVLGSIKPSNGAGSSSHGQSLASLVDAVVQLGGASEALQSLRKHLATQVRIAEGKPCRSVPDWSKPAMTSWHVPLPAINAQPP